MAELQKQQQMAMVPEMVNTAKTASEIPTQDGANVLENVASQFTQQ